MRFWLPDESYTFIKVYFVIVAVSSILVFLYEAAAQKSKKYTPSSVFDRFSWAKYYIMVALICFGYIVTSSSQTAGAFIYGGF